MRNTTNVYGCRIKMNDVPALWVLEIIFEKTQYRKIKRIIQTDVLKLTTIWHAVQSTCLAALHAVSLSTAALGVCSGRFFVIRKVNRFLKCAWKAKPATILSYEIECWHGNRDFSYFGTCLTKWKPLISSVEQLYGFLILETVQTSK